MEVRIATLSENTGISGGIDLTKIGKIVLSHSHDDHTGGLRDMLRRIRKKMYQIK